MRQEARRQFAHILFGSFFIAVMALVGIDVGIAVAGIGLLLGLALALAIRKGWNIPILAAVVQRVQREHERFPGKGAIFFFLGALVTMLLFGFNPLVVLGALIVSTYGDAASTIFGLRFGRTCIIGKKTAEGTIAGIVISLAFLIVLFQWWVALIAAVVGMLAELLPGDDSFNMPIIAAMALVVLL